MEFRDRVLRSPLIAHVPGTAFAAGQRAAHARRPSDVLVDLRARRRQRCRAGALSLGAGIGRARTRWKATKEATFWRVVADFPAQVRERDPRSLLISMASPLRDVRRVLRSDRRSCRGERLRPFAAVGRVGNRPSAVSLCGGRAEVDDSELRNARIEHLNATIATRCQHDRPALSGGGT